MVFTDTTMPNLVILEEKVGIKVLMAALPFGTLLMESGILDKLETLAVVLTRHM